MNVVGENSEINLIFSLFLRGDLLFSLHACIILYSWIYSNYFSPRHCALSICILTNLFQEISSYYIFQHILSGPLFCLYVGSIFIFLYYYFYTLLVLLLLLLVFPSSLEVEHLFICLLAILIFFYEVPDPVFCPFFIGLSVFFLLMWRNSVCIFGYVLIVCHLLQMIFPILWQIRAKILRIDWIWVGQEKYF